MKIQQFFGALGLLSMSAATAEATILGFGQIGADNATVSSTYGSDASANANGLVVSNGGTPNIALTWDANWDVHSSSRFTPLETLTVGGGAWDDGGGFTRVGQLDLGVHTITFAADAGFALVLNSFDFIHTNETAGTTTWDFVLRNSTNAVVWSKTGEVFDNRNATNLRTINPGFTGVSGETYTLTFDRRAQSYVSNGRHAIDNLSFNQVAVPEPTTITLLGLGVACLLRRKR